MKKLFVSLSLGLAALLPMVALVTVGPAFAACDGTLSVDNGINCAAPGGVAQDPSKLKTVWRTVTNTLVFVVGTVAVLMIIIGGLMYVLSAGDPSSTKKAKDTILYAIIGVVVAILAYAIVKFVLIKF
ncbi:MAG TPA: pilin [Candidatus Nanoarchaeia archaeon]|nr:pilin [Candidatus Nanoarchaeia archaeon]